MKVWDYYMITYHKDYLTYCSAILVQEITHTYSFSWPWTHSICNSTILVADNHKCYYQAWFIIHCS